jgi:vacuolar-type H+-ATPase subunit I/STV1
MADTPEPSPASPDWSAQAADTVVDLVDNVRAKTTGPLLTAAKAVVYGIIALVIALVALVLVSVALMRVVNVYLPGGVWLSYFLVGGLFIIVGLMVWSQRGPAESTS